MDAEWLRRPENGVAVIFVHGVLSSGKASWRSENGSYWPALLLEDETSKQAGIYVFTYRTNLFSGSYSLGDVVDALKEQMRLDGLFDCHTLLFVGHSMGGIVVRKLIVERAADFRDRGTRIGLFLVASPSLGSNYANLLAPLARLVGHTQADALRFSQDNGWLNDLDKAFGNLKAAGLLRMVGKELVEDTFITMTTVLRGQVVEPFSAARYFGEPFKVPGSDHFTIAAPESARALQHRLLTRFLADLPAATRAPEPARTQYHATSAAENHVVCVNDLLPTYGEIVRGLRQQGIGRFATFGGTSDGPGFPMAPDRTVVMVGAGVDLDLVRRVVNVVEPLGLAGLCYSSKDQHAERVYIGTLVCDDGQFVPFDSSLHHALERPSLTWGEFRAMISVR